MSTGKQQPNPVSVSGCQPASSVRPPTSGRYQNKVDRFRSRRWVSVNYDDFAPTFISVSKGRATRCCGTGSDYSYG